MEGDFSFIGNRYHLDIADDDDYTDLLLYHRRLIAIDLKIGKLKSEYLGKIWDNFCINKNRMRIEYTLKAMNKPTGVAM